MLKRKIGAFLTAAIMTCSAVCSTGVNAAPQKNEGMREISTTELVHEMGIGINLGNTMEACGDWIAEVEKQWGDGILETKDYETAWGSPVITQPMIQGMAEEGFGVVRVPVAWSNMMEDDGTYTINAAYTARVQQIVDWVIDADMYCIINLHWDNGWMGKFPEDPEGCLKRYEVMWTQIADAFKDYDDHLMFESQNEDLGWESVWNPWSGTQEQKARSYAYVNQVNQKFVDVIRASGGNNPKRHLLISGYNTGFDRTCDPLFKMPSDPADRMAVSVHYYTPAGFAILEDKDESWAKARATWGTAEDYKELEEQMNMMKTHYADKGIPVIIGEYGCPTKGKEPESVRKFLSAVCRAAYERGLCPVLWATPQDGERPEDTLSGHYNRTTCQLSDPELQKEFHAITGFKPVEKSAGTTDPSTEAPAFKKGDVNQDGEVNILDIITLQKWLFGADSQAGNLETSDLNADNTVDIFDLGLLKQLILSAN